MTPLNLAQTKFLQIAACCATDRSAALDQMVKFCFAIILGGKEGGGGITRQENKTKQKSSQEIG